MFYHLTSPQNIHYYECSPEVVVFDILTKNTLLLPAAETALFLCFDKDKNPKVAEEQLKKSVTFFSTQTDSASLFYDSLSTLIQLNLIESIE